MTKLLMKHLNLWPLNFQFLFYTAVWPSYWKLDFFQTSGLGCTRGRILWLLRNSQQLGKIGIDPVNISTFKKKNTEHVESKVFAAPKNILVWLPCLQPFTKPQIGHSRNKPNVAIIMNEIISLLMLECVQDEWHHSIGWAWWSLVRTLKLSECGEYFWWHQ